MVTTLFVLPALAVPIENLGTLSTPPLTFQTPFVPANRTSVITVFVPPLIEKTELLPANCKALVATTLPPLMVKAPLVPTLPICNTVAIKLPSVMNSVPFRACSDAAEAESPAPIVLAEPGRLITAVSAIPGTPFANGVVVLVQLAAVTNVPLAVLVQLKVAACAKPTKNSETTMAEAVTTSRSLFWIFFIWVKGCISVLIVLGLSLIHISEPTRLGMISYAVFCLKK